jgi:autotransporter-associated beta strand protein
MVGRVKPGASAEAKRSGRVRLTGLLASTSVAALLIGGAPAAWAGCAVIQNGGSASSVSNSSPAGDCIVVEGSASVSGNVTNTTSGILTAHGGSAPSRTGVTITNSTVGGDVLNAGRISASSSGVVVGQATVSGGISNSGTISAGATGVRIGAKLVTNAAPFTQSSFGGGISNSGSLTAGGNGIWVGGVAGISSTRNGAFAALTLSTFSGGITNSGSLTAGGNGIFVGGIAGNVYDTVTISTFIGGISNNGTISSGRYAIVVGGVATSQSVVTIGTFAGGITNTGTLYGGIQLGPTANGFGSITISNFSGGVSNSGTAYGRIDVGATNYVYQRGPSLSTFSGGVTNSGLVSGIQVGIGVTFAGGISNSGTITNGGRAVDLYAQDFSGGIDNSATISGGQTGIEVEGSVSNFAGGITNSGTISEAGIGIQVIATTFSNGITNNGTIVANSVDALGIYVTQVSSFSGGITNTGTISGHLVGIIATYISTLGGSIVNTGLITSPTIGLGGYYDSSLSISNFGTISGGLDAIQFFDSGPLSIFDSGLIIGNVDLTHNSAGNSFTLGPGYSITGGVAGTGGDIFQLGGSGSGAFDLSAIGTQYTGFNSFNVVSAAWITTGTGAQDWTIANGATLQLGDGIVADGGAIDGDVTDNGTFIIDRADTYTFAGLISGSGAFVQAGPGTTVLTGANLYGGDTEVDAGTLLLSGLGTLGAVSATTTINPGGTLDLGGTTQTQAALDLAGGTLQNGSLDAPITATGGIINNIGGSASLTAISGTTVIEGTDTYTGATNINGGTLEVVGRIAGTASVNVNAGGTLSGAGTVDPLTVAIASGATLAPGTPGMPGTAMTIAGNLTFQPGALYVIYVNPAASTAATVTGTAALAGTVQANFAAGRYARQQTYDILHAASLTETNVSLTTVNTPPNYSASLSYTPTDALLTLTAALGAGTGFNPNQQSVDNAIDAYFNNGGTLSPGFVNLFALTGPQLANAFAQIDGEDATGAEHGAFDLMDNFLGVMLDPFVGGRDSDGDGSSGAQGSAPDHAAMFADAGVSDTPPKQMAPRRWTAWATGFGGTATSDGDATAGTNDVTTSTYGYAGGLDYHYSADTTFGFSLGGGGTNWNVSQGLGSGRSDALLAGIYGVTHDGPAYLAGALGFANNWFTTDRMAFAGDKLTASFTGQSYSARLEGGYRFAVPIDRNVGVTPYAALQAQDFHTPSYRETDVSGGGFALSYDAMNGTDTRGELGARFDDRTALGTMPLILRAKLAWAHDETSNHALTASFSALPGSNFTVKGAPIPRDSALTSVAAQLFLTPRWSLVAKFDSEFASGARLYAGTGTLRYSW